MEYIYFLSIVFLFTHLGDFKDDLTFVEKKRAQSHYCILFLSRLICHPVSLPQTEKKKTLSFHLPRVHAVIWWCECLFESLCVLCRFPFLFVGVEPDDISLDACPPGTEICW